MATARFLLMSAALALLLSSNVRAQATTDRAAAARHYERGLELLQEEAYAQAIIEFERAWELSLDAQVLYNLGMSYVASNRPVDAVDALTRYVASEGARIGPEEKARIEDEIARQTRRIAFLALGVTPEGALVQLDGKEVGTAPLAEPLRLGVGAHEVEVSRPGFLPTTRSVTVAGEERRTLEIALARLADADVARMAQVPVSCGVPDVTIVLDGEVVGQTPLGAPLLVAAGAHELGFRRDGYVERALRLEVPAGPVQAVECGLLVQRELPVGLAGRLVLRRQQPDARALVDGAALPPDGRLPIGRHLVTVETDGFEPLAREIVLQPGGEVVLDVEQRPTRAVAQAHASGASTQRTIGWALGGAGVAAGIAAGIVFAINDADFDQFERDQREGTLTPTQVAEVGSSIQTLDAVTVVLAVGGGALLTAGVVLLLTAGSGEQLGSEGVALTLDPSARSGGLRASVAF
jgi:hypothetical protein